VSTEELRLRCACRELTSAVMELRKSAGLKLGDLVDVFLSVKDDKSRDFMSKALVSNKDAVVSRMKHLPTVGSSPGVVFASSSCVMLRHEKNRSFKIQINFTKPTPILNRSELLKKFDVDVVDTLASMIAVMSTTNLPPKDQTLSLGVFKNGEISLKKRVVVTLKRGTTLFASASEASEMMS